MSTEKKMTFEEFKAELITQFGENNFSLNEVGRHGWTGVDDILDGKPGGKPGPHWCDVSPRPRTQKLLAKYDFVTQIATFFPVWDHANRTFFEVKLSTRLAP